MSDQNEREVSAAGHAQSAYENAYKTEVKKENKDRVVLQDIGYLQNLFQGSVSSRRLKLTLYVSHLKFEDADTAELLEDVPIGEIKKTSKLVPSGFYGSAYVFLFAKPLMIETPKKKYKFSWTTADVASFGDAGWRSASIVRDQPRNMDWVKAIASLKKGQVPDTSEYSARAPKLMPNLAPGDPDYVAPSKVFGYCMIFLPLIFVVICGSVYFYYTPMWRGHQDYALTGLFLGTLLGLPALALGLLFGLRNIRSH